jgi:hypothetical protein
MSLQIGYTQPLLTNRERLWLSSVAQSNLIVLNTTLPATNIAFDNQQRFLFGLAGDAFHMTRGAQRIGTFGTASTFLEGPLRVGSDVMARSIALTQSLNTPSTVSSNLLLSVTTPTTFGGVNKFLSVRRDNGIELAFMNLNERGESAFYVSGRFGIGTADPSQALHVRGSTLVEQNFTVNGLINASTLRFPAANNSVNLGETNRITLNTNTTVVTGDMQVLGRFNADQIAFNAQSAKDFTVERRLAAEYLFLSNMSLTTDTLALHHNTWVNPSCNVLQLAIELSCNVAAQPVLTVTGMGALGLGTTAPDAALEVRLNPALVATCNVVEFCGDRSDTCLTFDRQGRLGIGTTSPGHRIHVWAAQNRIAPVEAAAGYPMIVLQNNTSNMSFLNALSNQQPVLHVGSAGQVTVGRLSPDPSWNVSIESNLRVPILQTATLRAPLPARELRIDATQVSFTNTTLCNVHTVFASNMVAQTFYAKSNILEYMQTIDYSIPAFDVFNTRGYFGVKLPNTWIQSSNVFLTNEMGDQMTLDSRTQGRLRIEAPPAATLDTETVGLHVFGAGRAGALVSAGNRPFMQWRITNGSSAALEMARITLANEQETQLQMTHSEITTVTPFALDSKGVAFMNRRVRINTDGRLMIESLNPTEAPTSTTASLYVRNDVRFDSSTRTPVFNFYANTGRVAIGNIPDQSGNKPFQVAVESAFTEPILVSDTPLVLSGNRGNLGIGVESPTYKLHVSGDINIDGVVYQRGGQFFPSPWRSQGNNLFILGSNVGIGTADARGFGLNVEGSAFFNNNVTFRGAVTTQGTISSISDRSIKTNLEPLHNALASLKSITGYRYDRTDTGAKECGLIAQEVERIAPELVHPSGDLLTIAYGNMAALFVEAIKTLDARLSALEEAVQATSRS